MKVADIRNISILGTGTMAPGIAQLCAQSGHNVTMWGRTDQSLHRAF
ncbi:3-hydroxyacyl-CoA dehydrogenase NAD-binding domain-containing protein, partial [Chloroflexota bacterium]